MAVCGASLTAAIVALLLHACQAHVDASVLVQDASEDAVVELGEDSDDDVTNLMQETLVVDRPRGSKVRLDASGGWLFYAIQAVFCAVLLLAPALLHSGIATGVVGNFDLARNSVGVAVSGGATFLGPSVRDAHGRSLSAQSKNLPTVVHEDVLDENLNEDEHCCDFAFVPGLQRSAELIPATDDSDVTDDMASVLMAEVNEELNVLGSMSRLQNHAELRAASRPSESQVAQDVVDFPMAGAEAELDMPSPMFRLQEDAEIEFLTSDAGSTLTDEVAENIMKKLSFWLDRPSSRAEDDELAIRGSMSRIQRNAKVIPAEDHYPAKTV